MEIKYISGRGNTAAVWRQITDGIEVIGSLKEGEFVIFMNVHANLRDVVEVFSRYGVALVYFDRVCDAQ